MAGTDTIGNLPNRAEQGARRAVGQARPWIAPLARAGYTAKGIVYVLVGLLAAQAAMSATSASSATDSGGAFSVILAQPAGRVVLGLVAVGLLGYALWRAVSAIADTENQGHDGKGMVRRVGYGISALLHLSLAMEAFRLVRGSASGSGGDAGAEHWTARALDLPLGQWLVGIAGAITIGYGLYQVKRGFDGYIQKRLDLGGLDASAARWAVRFGRFGTAARGVVFALIGWFLIQAARAANAAEAGGLGEALRSLEQRSYGRWLLGAVALGLVAYGLFQFVNARYRRITV